jgi:hypothetical protein
MQSHCRAWLPPAGYKVKARKKWRLYGDSEGDQEQSAYAALLPLTCYQVLALFNGRENGSDGKLERGNVHDAAQRGGLFAGDEVLPH